MNKGGIWVMRLWHWQLLPYLPDLQFKGQLRELVKIMRDWRDKGRTNHLLINRVMDYPVGELATYYALYFLECKKRNLYIAFNNKIHNEFENFVVDNDSCLVIEPFNGWHNKDYLRVCMANLYEKHKFGKGKSRITEDEWQRLIDGYRNITGEEYKI